ncbi:MAG TPA: hypothetical protein VNG69_06670 [Casimicrobiaceae bacterium]|nr:hypothetical protein [Casimicrobiaceae bacterium]
MSAIDAEIRGNVSTLESLATALQLLQETFARSMASRALATHTDWLNIGLTTPDRQQLFDASQPYEEKKPFTAAARTFEQALKTGKV